MSNFKPIVVFDIDGTLADTQHRLHYIKVEDGNKKDWKAFFNAAPLDPPIQSTININRMYYVMPSIRHMILLTGRPENTRPDTEAWLERYDVKYDILLMRSSNDRRPDNVVKKERLLTFLTNAGYFVSDIEAIFEDRAHVAKEWHQLGLPVFLVGNEQV